MTTAPDVDATASAEAEQDRRERRRRRVRLTLGLWGALVAVVLLWQTLTYRGLMALAAEWQFNTFGRYYPSLTYILLAALIASPVLLLLRGRRAREQDAAVRIMDAAALPGLAFIRTILGVSAGCFGAALVVLIVMATLPGESGPVERIVLGTPAAANPPRTGPTILVGTVARDRTAGLNQDLLIAHRTMRFAPMLTPGVGPEAVRFFVEIGPNENAATLRPDGLREGVLRRHGLPGELEKLFRYAGIDVAEPYYTLYASSAGLTWPYRVAAAQLGLVGLVCLLAGGLLHLRRERLRRRIHRDRVNAA